MDIKKFIGEATEYDKKQEVEHRKVKSWLKSVSAFANGDGGCLLFGIADDDTVVGLEDAKEDSEFVSQKIKERIDPVPQINMKMEQVNGKEILLLHVLPGNDTPYYYLAHTEFLPSTVTVYANKKQLDELQSVEIEPFNMRNLQDTIHRSVPIKKIRGMKIVPQMVRLAVYPDVLTEESVEVPVTAINMPDNMVLRTFPSKVAVRFTIGASLFRTIKPSQFKVVVDYNDLANNPSDKCKLQLRSVPRSVSKAHLELKTVDYLLEQQ